MKFEEMWIEFVLKRDENTDEYDLAGLILGWPEQ